MCWFPSFCLCRKPVQCNHAWVMCTSSFTSGELLTYVPICCFKMHENLADIWISKLLRAISHKWKERMLNSVLLICKCLSYKFFRSRKLFVHLYSVVWVEPWQVQGSTWLSLSVALPTLGWGCLFHLHENWQRKHQPSFRSRGNYFYPIE